MEEDIIEWLCSNKWSKRLIFLSFFLSIYQPFYIISYYNFLPRPFYNKYCNWIMNPFFSRASISQIEVNEYSISYKGEGRTWKDEAFTPNLTAHEPLIFLIDIMLHLASKKIFSLFLIHSLLVLKILFPSQQIPSQGWKKRGKITRINGTTQFRGYGGDIWVRK